MESLLSYFQFFSNINWREIFYVSRVVFIILDVFLIIGIFFVIKKSWHYRPDFRYPRRKKVDISQGSLINISDDWKKIMDRAQNESPQVLTLAIIDADKLVDDTLRMLGFTGEHVAERLERLGKSQKMKTLNSLWQAHRIRNNLVHATGFQIASRQAREVLSAYEDFFKELKVL